MFVTKSVAVMMVVPVVPVARDETARPLVPAALLIVATAVSDDSQKTKVVTSSVVPSAKVSLAVNCVVVPREMTASAGVGVTTMVRALLTLTVVDP